MLKVIFQHEVDFGRIFSLYGSVFVFFLMFVMYVPALVASLTIFCISIINKWSAQQLLRINLAMRLLHLPVHLFFLLAFLLLPLIPIVEVATFFLLAPVMTISLTGLIGLAGVIRAYKEKTLSFGSEIILGIFQFVFLGDVICSIVAYIEVREANRKILSAHEDGKQNELNDNLYRG
jgi:hypothetical protein